MSATENVPYGENGTPQVSPRSEQSAAISRLIVSMFSQYTARGPTRARAHIDRDVITVILKDTLTKGERSLVRGGKKELVQSTRFAFQQTMEEALVQGVEEIVGRKVIAFMSANHLEPDMAAEVFVLAPDADPRNPQGVGLENSL
jgi:uncharacterized protein YbcI